MDVSSKQEKIKMDALCELTAKIQQNPHPGKVFLLVQNKHSVHVSVGFARTASLNSNLKNHLLQKKLCSKRLDTVFLGSDQLYS